MGAHIAQAPKILRTLVKTACQNEHLDEGLDSSLSG